MSTYKQRVKARKKAKFTHKAWITKVYGRMKQSSRERKDCHLYFTKQELIEWIYSLDGKFEKLHKEWVDSEFKKDLVPSIDRKDDYMGYSLDNIVLTTWQINNARGRMGIKNKNQCSRMATDKLSKEVEQLDLDGNIINTFKSVREASRVINKPKSVSFLSATCRGEYLTAYGFKWRYKNA